MTKRWLPLLALYGRRVPLLRAFAGPNSTGPQPSFAGEENVTVTTEPIDPALELTESLGATVAPASEGTTITAPAAMATVPATTVETRTHAVLRLLVFMSVPLVGDAQQAASRWQIRPRRFPSSARDPVFFSAVLGATRRPGRAKSPLVTPPVTADHSDGRVREAQNKVSHYRLMATGITSYVGDPPGGMTSPAGWSLPDGRRSPTCRSSYQLSVL